jgi:hypothetical protein
MNRCFPNGLNTIALSLSFVLLWGATASNALAQVTSTSKWVAGAQSLPMRQFPPKAVRATMHVLDVSDVTMNGKPERLSPGVRMHNFNNSLVLTGALVGQTMVVNYVREAGGLIHDVWILNEAEIAQPDPSKQAQSPLFLAR